MRTDPDCVFCKIVTGEVPCFKLFEDDETLAFMDINPANPGHALAIAKEHWEDLYAIPGDLLGATARTAQRVAEAISASWSISPAGAGGRRVPTSNSVSAASTAAIPNRSDSARKSVSTTSRARPTVCPLPGSPPRKPRSRSRQDHRPNRDGLRPSRRAFQALLRMKSVGKIVRASS